ANTAPQSAAAVVPILNSRPNATAVLYLDFDGEIVNDSDWSDTPIVAEPARLTSTQIKETWARVKEDYLPFNINITTDVTRYYAAPIGHRMRCIVTPTNKWLKSSSVGGIALLGSFSDGGSFYSSTVPCWAFATSDPKDCAEVIAHEAGHTFGLSHDGTTSEEYYEGHGNGPLGWAPIMGAGYYEGITQWSKGEYPFANNTENDLAIISSGTNGFGYAASDAASSIATATQIFPTNGRFSQDAFIGKTGEIDFYKIDVESPGPFAVTATPVVPGGNMAAYVKLYRSDGSIVAGSPFSSTPAASVTTDISPGIYYVSVQGTGKTASGSDFGFTNYGSIGGYHLDAGTPIITFQPDIVAGKNPTAGRDHYGNEVQRLVVKVRNTKSIHVPISITNVGANSDSFHLRAGNLIGYKFRVILRSRDITTAIRHSGYFSEAIAASASLNMTLIIHPSKPVRTKSRLKLDAISIGDGSKSDTIIIELQPKK
ncbi:MAG: M12 family metallo-peptidase, partial [Chthoniobacterales bacterium]